LCPEPDSGWASLLACLEIDLRERPWLWSWSSVPAQRSHGAATRRNRSRDGARSWPSQNPAGAHFLTDRTLIDQLVRGSGAGIGDLVFDLGAGYGALIAPLVRTGAKVIAIELDPRLAERLRRRFGGEPQVGVVEADLRQVPLPRRPFRVVASPPFALTTLLCRRLLGDGHVQLSGAELVLEWGAAKWLANPEPRDRETASWAARYEMRIVRRVPAASFSPSPSSDAAYLRIRRRR
jgi:23S rRNA (adenine-N6)-dimethyltransferase